MCILGIKEKIKHKDVNCLGFLFLLTSYKNNKTTLRKLNKLLLITYKLQQKSTNIVRKSTNHYYATI